MIKRPNYPLNIWSFRIKTQHSYVCRFIILDPEPADNHRPSWWWSFIQSCQWLASGSSWHYKWYTVTMWWREDHYAELFDRLNGLQTGTFALRLLSSVTTHRSRRAPFGRCPSRWSAKRSRKNERDWRRRPLQDQDDHLYRRSIERSHWECGFGGRGKEEEEESRGIVGDG